MSESENKSKHGKSPIIITIATDIVSLTFLTTRFETLYIHFDELLNTYKRAILDDSGSRFRKKG